MKTEPPGTRNDAPIDKRGRVIVECFRVVRVRWWWLDVMLQVQTKADGCAVLDVVDDKLAVENGSGRRAKG